MNTISKGDLFLPIIGIPETLTATRHSNEELIEEFLDWKRSYTRWAFERYRVWVTRFQLFVNCAPESITSRDYVQFAESIKGSHAPKGVQYALNIIHNYLRYFSEQGRLGFPMFFIRVPKARAESHYCISEEEYGALLDMAQGRRGELGLRDEVVIRMIHDTGMRIGELLALKIEDLQSDRSACIPTEKTVDDRHVFWTVETDTVLRSYLQTEVMKAISEGGECRRVGKHLFPSPIVGGRPITARRIERSLKNLCRRAGLTDRICPHSFRHAFIHRMARKGVPDSVTALLVGHSTPMTIAHYTKLSCLEQRRFVDGDLI